MAKQISYDIVINSEYAINQLNDWIQKGVAGANEYKQKVNEALGGTVTKKVVIEEVVNSDGTRTATAVVKEQLSAWDQIAQKQKDINRIQEGSLTQLRQQVNEAKQARDAIASQTPLWDLANQKVQELNQKLQQASGAQAGSINALKQQVNEAKQVRDNIARIVIETDKYGTSVKRVNPAWQEANAEVQRLNLKLAEGSNSGFFEKMKAKFPIVGEVLSLGNGLTQVINIFQAVLIIVQQVTAGLMVLVNRAKDLQALRLALSGFAKDQEAINGILASSKGIALSYGVSLEKVESAYKRITPTILAAGGSLGQTEEVITALTARTTQLGLSAEQSGRYIEAFAQVMGKGKLQAEELNQQFSELDGALRAQVAGFLAFNYGIYDLNEAMKSGEITAGMFREAIVAVSKDAVEQLKNQVGSLQENFDKLNISQILSIAQTLDAISFEKIGQSLAPLGEAFGRIFTVSRQWLASIASSTPGLAKFFNESARSLGIIIELIVNGFYNGLNLIVRTVDLAVQAFYRMRDAVLNNPLTGPFTKGVQFLGNAFLSAFRQGTDGINKLGEGVDYSTGKLREQAAQAGVTGQALLNAYNQAEAGRKKAEENLDVEIKKLEAIQEQINKRYDLEIERLEDLKTKKEAQLTAEKEALTALKAAIKERYDAELADIEARKNAITAAYDAELAAINQLTPAQQAQKDIQRQKLENIIASKDATIEEKINAQAQLDTMNQQVASAQVKLEREQALKALADEKAAADARYAQETADAEKASKARQEELIGVIKGLANEIAKTKEEQKIYNERIDEAKNKTKDLYIELNKIPGVVKDQVDKVYEARNAYTAAGNQANYLANQIGQAAENQRALNSAIASQPAPRRARFTGGPVSSGETYTVNELGPEGFLSSSGILSAINKPAWGEWMAPSSGTVIPAHIFATIRATESAAETSGAHNMNYGGGLQSLAGMLGSISSGSRDNIVNNVTIQSDNTTQAASDILVQLTKIRRRRYS